MRTKDDPIDYKRDFFGLESYLCDSFGQLQGEAMSKIDSRVAACFTAADQV